MRLKLILTLILVFSHECVAQNLADDAQRLAFDKELKNLAGRFELNDKQLIEIREAAVPKLNQAIKKWAKFNSTVSVPADLDREVVVAMLKEAKPFVEPDKLDSFLETQKQIWESYDNQSRRILVYVLSRHLRLSELQRQQILNLFAANWDYRADTAVRMAVFNGVEYLDTVLDEFGAEKIEPILTEAQRELYSDLEARTANFSEAMNHSNEWKSKLQSDLELALNLELEKLAKALELNQSQITKLRIAGKGSMKRLIGFHESTQFTFDDIRTVGVIMESFFEQIAVQGIWSRTIEKVLSEEQSTKWVEMETVRNQWRIDAVSYMNVTAACDGRGATFEERQALFELFRNKVSKFNDTDTIYALYFRVAEASDDEFQEVIGDELWENIQERLGVLRGSLEKLRSGKVESTRKRQ